MKASSSSDALALRTRTERRSRVRLGFVPEPAENSTAPAAQVVTSVVNR